MLSSSPSELAFFLTVSLLSSLGIISLNLACFFEKTILVVFIVQVSVVEYGITIGKSYVISSKYIIMLGNHFANLLNLDLWN